MSMSDHGRVGTRAFLVRGLIVAAVALGSGTSARAGQLGQLGAIVAPGPLSRAHATLDGVANCVRCHEAGRKQTGERCLSCHKPIAERIARKTGVHRAVTNDCARCHVEHGIAGAELRRFDTRTFDHAAETGFAFEGRHAAVAGTCTSCHPKRSFLEARAACKSCHADAHKTSLGSDCARCHSPSTPFKETRAQFDHTRAQFALIGIHRTLACAKCHAGGVFRGLRHDTCSACHQEPHRNKFGPVCISCHTQDHWTTRVVDHKKTGFTLVGAHTQLACTKCHPSGMIKPLRFDRCSACHVNVHRDSVKEDCRACHTEAGFQSATFDHGARTPFRLVGKHEGLPCRKCHTTIAADTVPRDRKVIDFGGMKSECAACHNDPHKAEYGRVCDTCHRPVTFKALGFTHPRSPDFFSGRHASLTCAQCHLRAAPQQARAASPAVTPRAKVPSMDCSSCHADAHLGQVGAACERCHAVGAERFAPSRFSHQQAAFQLTGRHQTVECVKCHPAETRAFPGGTGTAKRLKPTPAECRACHADPHMGQVSAECRTCHSTATFTLTAYKHSGLGDLFAGLHGRLPCQSCHKKETGQFPKGQGTAIRFKVGRTCAACHSQY